jgi:hypothetical protein
MSKPNDTDDTATCEMRTPVRAPLDVEALRRMLDRLEKLEVEVQAAKASASAHDDALDDALDDAIAALESP